ncbi:hypothetical protein ColTof4_11758 [Colletotrichum tofieldiae]|nr:hypothetical protein ColTof3_03166 [Colletotrichum tofieldiae]GKT79335.1 hypothetical protein ColTof4_11758 [Colletotrichum tofieldiae]GKT82506.1 hypothetical protein Ct61P_00356 [Colletotrichum tofieldiae]
MSNVEEAARRLRAEQSRAEQKGIWEERCGVARGSSVLSARQYVALSLAATGKKLELELQLQAQRAGAGRAGARAVAVATMSTKPMTPW